MTPTLVTPLYRCQLLLLYHYSCVLLLNVSAGYGACSLTSRSRYCGTVKFGYQSRRELSTNSAHCYTSRSLVSCRQFPNHWRDLNHKHFSRLHWLRRVVFKLAILVFKSLRGETPSYLVDNCELIADSGRRRLRSADANTLIVPRTLITLGSETGVFRWRDRKYGTVFPPHCENRTLNLCSSNDF